MASHNAVHIVYLCLFGDSFELMGVAHDDGGEGVRLSGSGAPTADKQEPHPQHNLQ